MFSTLRGALRYQYWKRVLSGYKSAEMCPVAETGKMQVGCASDLQEAGEIVKA